MSDQGSGIFDKVKDFIQGHPDKVDQGLDKAREVVDEKTGGTYGEQLDQAESAAREHLGVPNTAPEATIPVPEPGPTLPGPEPGQPVPDPSQPGPEPSPSVPEPGDPVPDPGPTPSPDITPVPPAGPGS